MWSGPPKTIKEYLQRQITFPWVITGVIWFIGLIVILITIVGERDPFRGFKPADDTNKWITSSMCAIGMVGVLIWAPIGTSRARNLLSRGKRISGSVVSVAALARHGSRPVSVEYTVNGQNYKFRRDLPDRDAQLLGQTGTVNLIYDSEDPGKCNYLPPSIASLPWE